MYEKDESVEEIEQAFEKGEKFVTGIADVLSYVRTVAEAQAELADRILDVLNNEKLELPERVVKIRKICKKTIKEFEKYN